MGSVYTTSTTDICKQANNVLTFFFCSSLLIRRLALDFVFTKQGKYLLLSNCTYRKPPQVTQLFRFSFRFRYDLTFQFQLLCGEFSQYTTLNKQSIACKKIFLLIYVTFVNAYVLRSHPLMQASVSFRGMPVACHGKKRVDL